MNSSKFGWSLPPGAAGDPNAPWNQDEGPCAVCCNPLDDCVCPECPECGEHGNPNCYGVGSGLIHKNTLKLSREQVAGRLSAWVRQLYQAAADAAMARDHIAEGGEFDSDLKNQPDPWA